MVRPRVLETDNGIQDAVTVELYNEMQRRFRDRGWLETRALIASGIDQGLALEIGPGPGYLGLEWLKQTDGTELRGLEISSSMVATAEANAAEYGLTHRARYVLGNARELPFATETFDAVFSNGSLHEWLAPTKIFDEIHRVLKPRGRYFISDLRRDLSPPVRWFMYLASSPREIRPGLITSMGAAYTPSEAAALLRETKLREGRVKANAIGLEITGAKS